MSAPRQVDRRAMAELAALLAAPDGRRILHLLAYASHALGSGALAALERIATTPLPDVRVTRDARVGIWQQEDAGEAPAFVRRTDLQPAALWSVAERIPPRTPGRRRVVLLGESVARGFFYDPHFNPAMCLRHMLGTGLGEEIEVIDLARIDIGMVSLLALCKEALLLQPDALVVWAGNNWHPSAVLVESGAPGGSLRLRRERRAESIKALMDETLQTLLTAFTSALASLPLRGVPLVFVIPEFNLADWRDITMGPALCSPAATTRWMDARDEARLALAAGDTARALQLGERLLAIDRGSTTAGYYAIADARRLRGEIAEARRILRLSREVALWWPRCLSSTTYAAARRHLATALPAAGVHLVDLTARFETDSPASLPDRRLFHDYCHHSAEGTRWCTAYIAERVLPLLGGPVRPAEQLAALDLNIAADVLAAANLIAGIYNADNEQTPDVVRHHLTKAVSVDPVGSVLIELFLDFRIRRAPSMLCDSLERLIGTVPMTAYPVIHGAGRSAREKPLHVYTINECVRALHATDQEAALRAQHLLLAEHGASGRHVDLLARNAADNPFVRQIGHGHDGFYRAFDRTSRFHLICDVTRPVTLQLTCRCPESRDPRTVSVRVNSRFVASFPANPRWRGESVAVPDEVLRIGINEVLLEWPAPDWDREQQVDQAAARLEENVVPELGPVFGHLAAFSAVMAPASRTSSTFATSQ